MIQLFFEDLLNEKIENLEYIPKQVGFLRDYYKLYTAKNTYFVKQIPDIFNKERLFNAHHIAKLFQNKGIPSICEMEINGTIFHEFDRKIYTIQEYIDGKNLTYDDLSEIHLVKLAELMANLHNNNPYQNHLHEKYKPIGLNTMEGKRSVLCHRDLTLENILWVDLEPHLIDFEWAGVHTQESSLVDMIIRVFPRDTDCFVQLNYFLKIYKNKVDEKTINLISGFYTAMYRDAKGLVLLLSDTHPHENNKAVRIKEMIDRYKFFLDHIDEINQFYQKI